MGFKIFFKKMPKFIEDNGILLPEFLFYFDTSKSKSISPAANFNPATALDGGDFESSTSPSKQPVKRPVIIDQTSLQHLDYGEKIALIKRLKIADFKILLRVAPPQDFYEIDEDLNGIERLQNLGTFNEATDYPSLAKHKVARDKALILDHQDRLQTSDIIRSFSATTYAGKFFGNDWKCEFRDAENTSSSVNDLDIHHLLFRLNRSTPEESRAAIKAYYDLVKKSYRAIAFAAEEDGEMSLEDKKRELDEADARTISNTYQLISATQDPDLVQYIIGSIPLHNGNAQEIFRNYDKFCQATDLLRFGIDLLPLINCAVKLFPDRKEELFNRYGASLAANDSDHALEQITLFSDAIKTFPQGSSYLINSAKRRLELLRSGVDNFLDFKKSLQSESALSYWKSDTKPGLRSFFENLPREVPESLEILVNIYEKKEISDSQKLKKLSDLFENKKLLASKGEFLAIFAQAESQSGLGDFYEKQLLQSLDLRDPINPTQLSTILESSSPRTAERISTLILDSKKDWLITNLAGSNRAVRKLLTTIINSCPQRQEELSHFLVSHPKIPRELDSQLPAKIRHRLHDLHPAIAKTSLSITLEEALATKYSPDSNAKPQQTYLEVLNLDSEEKGAHLDTKINTDAFRDVATIRFIGGDVEQINNFLLSSISFDLAVLEKEEILEESDIENIARFVEKDAPDQRARLRKSLKHVVLSKMEGIELILKTLEGLNISCEIIDDSNYLGILDSIPQPARRTPPEGNKIKIADGAKAGNVGMHDDAATPTFTMISAGEVLNNPDITTPQIRTHIIQRDVTANLDENVYGAANFVGVASFKSLRDEDVAEIRGKHNPTHSHYLFKQQLQSGVKTRLLSAHPEEEFFGLIGDRVGITIEKGDDDFFYATSNRDRLLSYVTKAPNPQSHIESYNRIPSNNQIKKIIGEYRNSPKYSHQATEESKNANYDPEDHEASMQRIFEARSGVCRHRVAAVEYKLRTSGIAPENFRIVDINRNHVVLEIKYDGKWVSVDLGGGAAATRDAASEDVYQASEAVLVMELPDLATFIKPELPADDISEISSLPLSGRNSPTGVEFVETASQTEDRLREEAIHAKTTQIRQAKQAALSAMAKSFLDIVKLQQINDEAELLNLTTNNNQNKILVVTNDLEKHSNFFLHQATFSQGRRTFYIDSPDKIDLHRTNLLIANDNKPRLSEEGLLSEFLDYAATRPEERPLLVINWSAFNPRQRLALNTVIDRERKINGVAIADSIQIIGLSDSASQDPSFLSRHNVQLESKVALPEVDLENTAAKTIIDLQGFSNWRRQLFGKVILNGGKMIWEKSPFVAALEAKQNNFEVCNLSPQAAEELTREFLQAKAVGKFSYHGHDIFLPADTELSCDSNSFAFDKFDGTPQISVARGASFDNAPADATLVNTQLFDLPLFDKRIDNAHGTYHEEKGLIDSCTSQPLKLFISSDLSDSQCYCLLNQMQQKDLALELHLAPEVNLPSSVKIEEIALVDRIEKNSSPIFVSNDPNKLLEEILAEEPEPAFATIDVEDLTYQDLVSKITFKYDENGFKNFTKTDSDFLTELRNGKKIVLKGQFDADLLQMLEPALLSATPEFAGVAENLTLIVEDKHCQSGAVYKPLKWLPQDIYLVKSYEKEAVVAVASPAPEAFNDSSDLSNSAAEAAEFIRVRKETFTKTLDRSSLLRLTGHSGVGKSRLLKMFEAEDTATTKACRELSSFEEWANDKSGKRKILFIDESNIEDLHFTMFSQLKNGGPQRIFYQGKFYDLDENHKVVFACNSADYGGGRFEQKLFEDKQVPEFAMTDFPASYIYEKILRESIYEKLSAEIKAEILEEDFKQVCQEYIEEYRNTEDLTVREFQEELLIRLNNTLEEELAPIVVKSPNYVSTSATKEVEERLLTALSIRQKQRDGIFPNKAVGLNGVLLEGDSGTGKSELIGATLAAKGIREIKLGEERTDNQQRFYKIDANLPLKQKRQIIVEAFENGDVIWIDEINSCIDDGLEKILNAALTGDHPNGTGADPKPGFMLISSVNSAGLEGRSIISPALLHRTIQPRVRSLKEYSCEDFAAIIEHWLSHEKSGSELYVRSHLRHQVCENIANHFTQCLNSSNGDNLNLRMLRDNLGKILPAHVELAKLHSGELTSPSPSVVTVDSENLDMASFIKAMTPTYFVEEAEKIKDSEVKLKLIHPTFFEADNDSDKYDYCSTRELESGGKIVILDTLMKTIDESKISKTLAAKIILSAIKNFGTSDEEKLKSDLRLLKEEPHRNGIRAQNFSALFQEKMKDVGLLTGNKESINLVCSGKRPVTDLAGKRLKRLTPDYALDLLKLEHGSEQGPQMFKKICEDLGINPTNFLENSQSPTKQTGLLR